MDLEDTIKYITPARAFLVAGALGLITSSYSSFVLGLKISGITIAYGGILLVINKIFEEFNNVADKNKPTFPSRLPYVVIRATIWALAFIIYAYLTVYAINRVSA